MPAKKNDVNLSKNLEALTAIADWFDEQSSVDVEEGLQKVKAAGDLIKASRGRLKEIENEFETVKKDIEAELADFEQETTED